MEEIIKKSIEIGKLEERSRILDAINFDEIPAGIWPVLKRIIMDDAVKIKELE